MLSIRSTLASKAHSGRDANMPASYFSAVAENSGMPSHNRSTLRQSRWLRQPTASGAIRSRNSAATAMNAAPLGASIHL